MSIGEQYLEEFLPEVRYFFFSEGKYSPRQGVVNVPFTNDYGTKTSITIPPKTDVKFWSLLAPYKEEGHTSDLLSYSAEVRLVTPVTIEPDDIKVRGVFRYSIDLYSISRG